MNHSLANSRSRRTLSAVSRQQSAVRPQDGYIALVGLLVIAAATLAIGLSVSSLSVAETQSGLIVEQTGTSFQLAEGCLDDAILRLRRNSGYSGGTLSAAGGSCTIAVLPSGNRRTITVTATVGMYARTIVSRVNLAGGTPILEFWREALPVL